MMRDTDAALCGHCFSPAFNEKRTASVSKSGTNKDRNTYVKTS